MLCGVVAPRRWRNRGGQRQASSSPARRCVHCGSTPPCAAGAAAGVVPPGGGGACRRAARTAVAAVAGTVETGAGRGRECKPLRADGPLPHAARRWCSSLPVPVPLPLLLLPLPLPPLLPLPLPLPTPAVAAVVAAAAAHARASTRRRGGGVDVRSEPCSSPRPAPRLPVPSHLPHRPPSASTRRGGREAASPPRHVGEGRGKPDRCGGGGRGDGAPDQQPPRAPDRGPHHPRPARTMGERGQRRRCAARQPGGADVKHTPVNGVAGGRRGVRARGGRRGSPAGERECRRVGGV